MWIWTATHRGLTLPPSAPTAPIYVGKEVPIGAMEPSHLSQIATTR